jgi:hypothetical protein
MVETNKLISIFMGFEDESRILGGGQRMRRKTEWKYGCQQYEQYGYDQLKYHSEWNWLMPVIDKIQRMVGDESLEAAIDRVCILPIYTERERVYKAVVKLIEFYNSQK